MYEYLTCFFQLQQVIRSIFKQIQGDYLILYLVKIGFNVKKIRLILLEEEIEVLLLLSEIENLIEVNLQAMVIFFFNWYDYLFALFFLFFHKAFDQFFKFKYCVIQLTDVFCYGWKKHLMEFLYMELFFLPKEFMVYLFCNLCLVKNQVKE